MPTTSTPHKRYSTSLISTELFLLTIACFIILLCFTCNTIANTTKSSSQYSSRLLTKQHISNKNKKLHQQQDIAPHASSITPQEALDLSAPPLKCFNKPVSSPLVCSGHGTCIASDLCQCNSTDWFGPECSLSVESFTSSFRVEYYQTIIIEGQQGPQMSIDYREGKNKQLPLNFTFTLVNSTIANDERILDEYNSSSSVSSEAYYENSKVLLTSGSYRIGVGVYVYGRLVFSTSSKVVVFNSAQAILLTQQELEEFTIVNVRDLLLNIVSLDKSQVLSAVQSLKKKLNKADVDDYVHLSSSYLATSRRQQPKRPTSLEEDDLVVSISEGLLNMSIPLLDQVRTNTINDTNVLRGVASDILNCSSILLGSGLSVNASAIRRNSHNSNIRNTIYSSASLLSLIRALESTTTTIKVENSAFNLIVSHQPDMQLGETQVQVPSSLLSSDNIDFTLVTYSSGIDFELLPDSNTTGLRSAANIVELRRLVDGEYDPLSELQNPIILSFPFFNNLTIFNSNFTQNFTCRYYNTTTSGWRTNGCKLVGKDDKFITCSCDHTTSFSAFVEYYPITTDPTTDPNNPTNSTSPTNKNTALKALDSGLVIFKIVISGILLLLIVSVMVGLIIFRKMQPVKSRYIFPFVGLIALFVDLAFTGIASKAATINVPLDELVSSNNTPNIINSISLVVTTSLTAVAICSYMVVCIRYIMYRYYYQWMSAVISQKLEKATSRGIRLFKNNTILLVSVFALGISIIAYFVMLVILRRTDQMNAKQFSYSSSISHFLIMISFLIVIGIVYMIDLIMDFRTRQISDELHDISNEINSTQQNTKGTMVTTFKKENTAFVASAKLKQLFGKNSAPSKIYH